MELFASALSLAYKYLGPPDRCYVYSDATRFVWIGKDESKPLLVVALSLVPNKKNVVTLNGSPVLNPLEMVGGIAEEISRREIAKYAGKN